ncbi:hypothetical protein DSM25558_0590 [Agrobacterium sp. DSM 25558]|uniref:hypothetical protein n=1 Tax=Agrobacterium sp. DSM 25558 TaxID=1907665 RepID=UPI0009726182|nr:hypothetical protein [Agrobacterium sp. DSM 25558]SCX03957.1 hypothetical protein DSM25558_0590 [Agrobacterium sp. DSM 25558]
MVHNARISAEGTGGPVRTQNAKTALADLMVADPEVIEFHYGYRNLIKASNKLMFHTAFALTRPIPASATVDIYLPSRSYRPGKPT